MPMDEANDEDPMELVGVHVPGASADADREMAECFVEEFVRLGHSEEHLMAMFTNPFYGGAYRATQALGEERIREMIRSTIQILRPQQRRSDDA